MRAAAIVAMGVCVGCVGANHTDYATAGAFAAAAGAMQAVEATRKTPTPPPPCAREVYLCPGASEHVCVTDSYGCRVCSCERAAPEDPASLHGPGSWH